VTNTNDADNFELPEVAVLHATIDSSLGRRLKTAVGSLIIYFHNYQIVYNHGNHGIKLQ